MDKDERHESESEEKTESTLATAPSVTEDAPDPEEDDLDGLDDMLDEFTATKVDASRAPHQDLEARAAETLHKPDSADGAEGDFGKQLQDQMAALMGNVDESPEMKREIEAMMRELGAAADPGPEGVSTNGSGQNKGGASSKGQSSSAEEPFQDTIRKTMERIQASGEQATAAAESEESDDLLAQMLKGMQDSGIEGAGDDGGFNKMLMGMMQQLTNKDILYEPMKELDEKFPAWLVKNQSIAAAEDLKRYKEQQTLVGEIVGRFELKSYSDSKAEDREFIVERMQQMQAAGSPPADLVGDMNAASDVLSNVDSGCSQQ